IGGLRDLRRSLFPSGQAALFLGAFLLFLAFSIPTGLKIDVEGVLPILPDRGRQFIDPGEKRGYLPHIWFGKDTVPGGHPCVTDATPDRPADRKSAWERADRSSWPKRLACGQGRRGRGRSSRSKSSCRRSGSGRSAAADSSTGGRDAAWRRRAQLGLRAAPIWAGPCLLRWERNPAWQCRVRLKPTQQW